MITINHLNKFPFFSQFSISCHYFFYLLFFSKLILSITFIISKIINLIFLSYYSFIFITFALIDNIFPIFFFKLLITCLSPFLYFGKHPNKSSTINSNRSLFWIVLFEIRPSFNKHSHMFLLNCNYILSFYGRFL